MRTVSWQYCKNLNDINEAIRTHDENWYGITTENIINITYDTNHGCYVVFWRCDDEVEYTQENDI